MRDILDELMETIHEMWERSEDPEVEAIDVALLFKSAMLLAEGEAYLNPEHGKVPFPLLGKMLHRHVSNKTKTNKKQEKRVSFKFGRR